MALVETVAGEFFKRFFEWLTFKRKKRIAEIMLDSTDVRDLAKRIVENGKLCVDFCYLANAYNGRRKSKDHRFKYRTLVSGFHREHEFQEFKINEFRKVPVDVQYSNLLDTLIAEQSVIMSVWNMSEGWLRSTFIYIGFEHVAFYLIDDDYEKHEVWFLVVGSKTQDESDFRTPAHNSKIRLAIGELKNMIDEQRK